ncbi:hypothetical protein BU25DRAFT_422264 [Macroventuria anomochaeta]|uniref:Uncharacterized protein n=1 Tax=Macroventuria anomochaeta TaxID=301207 RepID=A0ACB6RYI7_9PLEO|nr:uncharacterized protein BU25DRAFT_422264 [Macroventuria anomochaeta]KAF2626941.1 hypothetical protein BU25DRAFT_422264 [Macroventuria anomochaeta]
MAIPISVRIPRSSGTRGSTRRGKYHFSFFLASVGVSLCLILSAGTFTTSFSERLCAFPLLASAHSSLRVDKHHAVGQSSYMVFAWRRLTVSQTGEYEISQSGPWSVRESFLATLVLNAIVVVPLFIRLFQTTIGTVNSRYRFSKDESYQLDSQYKSGSHMNSKYGKKRRFHHPPSLPIKWGSDEMITMDQQLMGPGGGGNTTKAGKDNVSEFTATDHRPSFEVDALTGQSKNKTKVGDSSRVSSSNVYPEDITVTREWEVATKWEGRNAP